MSQVETATREPLEDITNRASDTYVASAHSPARQTLPPFSTEATTTTETQASRKKSATEKPTKSSPSPTASHSTYSDMIYAAFTALSKPRSGVSKRSIVTVSLMHN